MGLVTTFHGNADFVRMLVDAQVEFLVVGGLAVVFYKCRDPKKCFGQSCQKHPRLCHLFFITPGRLGPMLGNGGFNGRGPT